MLVKEAIERLEGMLAIYRTLDPEPKLTSIEGPEVHVANFEDFKAILKGQEATCEGDRTVFWRGELNGVKYLCVDISRKQNPEALSKVHF